MKKIFIVVTTCVMSLASLGCDSEKSVDSRDVSADLSSCKGQIESAIGRAQSAGKSDTEAFKAGEEARDQCMSGKGY